jgi:hypothetical protein
MDAWMHTDGEDNGELQVHQCLRGMILQEKDTLQTRPVTVKFFKSIMIASVPHLQ